MNHLPRAVRNDALNQTGLVILALLEAHPGMTLRRLARACGIVTKRAHDHVRRLRRLGLVAFEDGRACTARLRCRFVPVGELAASPPVGAASVVSA